MTPSGLSRLPESITDPSRPDLDRLAAVLDQFRFIDPRTAMALSPGSGARHTPAPDPALLLDWAIARSGRSDPLATLNRTELEAAYDTFARRLHDQLRPLIRAAASKDLGAFARVIENAPPVGREAARRALPAANTRR